MVSLFVLKCLPTLDSKINMYFWLISRLDLGITFLQSKDKEIYANLTFLCDNVQFIKNPLFRVIREWCTQSEMIILEYLNCDKNEDAFANQIY